MTVEERILQLEQKIADMESKSAQRTVSEYAKASAKCDAYFEQVKMPEQHYGARMKCMEIARDAYVHKHRTSDRGRKDIRQCLCNEKDGEEFFRLFKAFADVYQSYLKEEL